MRTIVIALMLAVASAGAAAQTTEGVAQPSYNGEVFERTARFQNWGPGRRDPRTRGRNQRKRRLNSKRRKPLSHCARRRY